MISQRHFFSAVPKQDLPTMQQKFRNCFFRDVAMQTEEPHLLIDSESQLVQEKTEDIFQAKSDLEMVRAICVIQQKFYKTKSCNCFFRNVASKKELRF